MFNIELFEQRLKEKNLMQKELAEQLGIGKSSASAWKKGVYPQVNTLIQICKILDVSADDLLNIPRKESRPSPEEEKLLKHYRETDERGKQYIQEIARREAEQAREDEKLHISKIG